VQPPRPEEVRQFEEAIRNAASAFDAGDAGQAAALCASILTQVPGHVRALKLLAQVRRQENKPEAVEKLLLRAFQAHPNDDGAACDLALHYFQKRDLPAAERHARFGVRLAPTNAQAHNLMGMILTEQHRTPAGEFHYRRALELHPPVGKLCANLGLNLKQQGKVEEAERFYRQAMELEPENVDSLLGWVRLEEARANIDRAQELLDQAETLRPKHPALPHTRALLLRRRKRLEDALQALEVDFTPDRPANTLIQQNYEKGEILDKLGRYAEAFAAFEAANGAVRASGLRDYGKTHTENMTARLKALFTPERCALLPRAQTAEPGRPQPLFIIGFPRSGTTMVEQIVTSHPEVHAGDELHFMWDLTRIGQQILNSELGYPEYLVDLWMGDNQGALDNFRDYYLKRSLQIGACDPAKPWFTDKMPLNETNLGLIHLVFPHSPVIHLVRHPLDVILSCFFNDLTHGNNMSYGLESAAHHYVTIRGLLDHYLEVLDVRYLPVKYEDIVEDPEPWVRRVLDFAGLEFDPRCMAFHENRRYARTASYAQVTEKLYTRSRFRYRHYMKQLEPILPLLEPVIQRLGYDI
jgi:tetratricopeptide (TPR) repeat protein